MSKIPIGCSFFFFNDTATTEIYTLSLHDALPIFLGTGHGHWHPPRQASAGVRGLLAGGHLHDAPVRRHRPWADDLPQAGGEDRKSTRLNSSHQIISYAVFCLKKKKSNPNTSHEPL